MTAKITTMKALVEAIQDAAGTEEEAVATLTHLLSHQGLLLTKPSRATTLAAKSFF